MKKTSKKQQFRITTGRKRIILLIFILVAVPLFINEGLMITDIIYDKLGATLTAEGLSNANWLEFWEYYLSTAIAFLGIYLVWDTSNKDRKRQVNKDSSDQYLNRVSMEENTLVEVAQCFNTGILYKALNQLGETSIQESKAVLLSARDKMDEAHVKFELLTDIVDDFGRCSDCEHNPCYDKDIKGKISHTFYDMEKHYVNLLNLGDDYLNKRTMEKCNAERAAILSREMEIIKNQISYMQKQGCPYEELMQKMEESSNMEKQINELNKTIISQEDLDKMVQTADKEIKYLSEKRAKLIGYCKSYINLQKGHAREISDNGIIKYMKIKEK